MSEFEGCLFVHNLQNTQDRIDRRNLLDEKQILRIREKFAKLIVLLCCQVAFQLPGSHLNTIVFPFHSFSI